MTATVEPDLFVEFAQLIREGRVKLEITGGIPTWRVLPGLPHQRIIDRIRATIQRPQPAGAGCGCFHYADVDLIFPDGSPKRPDISIFCEDPPDVPGALRIIPQAIIEIVSVRYELMFRLF